MHRYRAETITVNNNFSHSDQLSWVRAVVAGSSESLTVFDARKRLILYNNRFGALDGADDDDLLDVYSVFGYFRNSYEEWLDALHIVKKVFTDYMQREFLLTHKTGWRCRCRAWPVMDNGKLGGVILLASKEHNGSELSVGDSAREQH